MCSVPVDVFIAYTINSAIPSHSFNTSWSQIHITLASSLLSGWMVVMASTSILSLIVFRSVLVVFSRNYARADRCFIVLHGTTSNWNSGNSIGQRVSLLVEEACKQCISERRDQPRR